MTNASAVCILMGTYNGEAFLAEQLLSIENQSHTNWRLIISDDGSTDATLTIAKSFQDKWGSDRLEIRVGPQQGFCTNFLSLACDPTIHADFYAFSDQDDVWMLDKLARALAYFDTVNNEDLPRVYGSRTQIVDQHLTPFGYSPLFALPRSFRNALVQSIAGGNTMVFNQRAKTVLEKTGLLKVVSHDWWAYQIVEGVGGEVYYDPTPTLLYRQHDAIITGSNIRFLPKVNRLLRLLNGQYITCNIMNYQALSSVNHLLSKPNQKVLLSYGQFRTAKMTNRYQLFKSCGLYRQTLLGNIALQLAVLLNKV